MSREPWSDEMINRLVELLDGGGSAAEIAYALGGGVTRNAVIGKVSRLGLKLQGSAVDSVRRAAINRKKAKSERIVQIHRAPASPRSSPPRVLVLVNVESSAKHLMELRSRHCRWPLPAPEETSPADWMFCGRDIIEDGCSWCADHRRVVWAPMRKSHREFERGLRKFVA